MKWLFATVLASAVAVANVSAQQPASQQPTGSTPATQTGAQGTEKQTPATPTTKKSATKPYSVSEQKSGEQNLGTVHITRKVTADGKPLAPGAYQVRLTQDDATPPATGTDPKLERWAEFVQGGKVKGREVVSIVPQSDVAQVVHSKPPRPGGSKVELLKGNEYLRVWINKGGTNYLIHLPTGETAKGAKS